MKKHLVDGWMVGSVPATSNVAVYLASEVDAREQQATATIQAQRRKIEELEKLLREVYDHGETSALHTRIGRALGDPDQSNGDL